MKPLKIMTTIFAVVGAGMIIGAVFMVISTNKFLDGAIIVNGEVMDLVESYSEDSTTYAPVVAYRTETGDVFSFKSNTSSNPPSYSIGEQIEVLYSPSDPRSARINSFFSLWGGSVIVGILGSVFFLIGGGIILGSMLGGRKEKYLKEHGVPITAKFKSVELNESFEVNGRNPFKIVVEWLNSETQELFIYKSNNLWFDPSDYIKQDEITVYVDKNNPKKYFVDTSFLPKVVE